MIVIFNEGLSSEVSYSINSCGSILDLIPDDNGNIQEKEQFTMMKQITAIDPTVTGKSTFSKLFDPDYVIITITILNDQHETLLKVEGFNLTTCSTQLGHTDRGEVGKFATLTFLKNQGGL